MQQQMAIFSSQAKLLDNLAGEHAVIAQPRLQPLDIRRHRRFRRGKQADEFVFRRRALALQVRHANVVHLLIARLRQMAVRKRF